MGTHIITPFCLVYLLMGNYPSASQKRNIVVQLLSCVWLFVTPRTAEPRLPYPSLSPRVCSNSFPLSLWHHPTISSSVAPFSSWPLSQHQGLFQWVGSLHQVAKVLELQLQHQSFQWIFRVDFLSDWLAWSLCSLRDYQESYPALQFQKHQFLGAQLSL